MRVELHGEAAQAGDEQALTRSLETMSEAMGFGLLGLVTAVANAGGLGVHAWRYLGNAPPMFDAAPAAEWIRRDPVTRRLRKETLPFTCDQGLSASDGAGDLWEEQAPFECGNGLLSVLRWEVIA